MNIRSIWLSLLGIIIVSGCNAFKAPVSVENIEREQPMGTVERLDMLVDAVSELSYANYDEYQLIVESEYWFDDGVESLMLEESCKLEDGFNPSDLVIPWREKDWQVTSFYKDWDSIVFGMMSSPLLNVFEEEWPNRDVITNLYRYDCKSWDSSDLELFADMSDLQFTYGIQITDIIEGWYLARVVGYEGWVLFPTLAIDTQTWELLEIEFTDIITPHASISSIIELFPKSIDWRWWITTISSIASDGSWVLSRHFELPEQTIVELKTPVNYLEILDK